MLILSFADVMIPYFIICFFVDILYEPKKIFLLYVISLILHFFHWNFIGIQVCMLFLCIYMYKNTLNDSRIKYVHVLLLFIAIQFLSGNMCHMVISVVTNIPFTLEDIFQLDYNSYVIYEIILSLILLTVLNVKSASSSKMRIIKQKLYLTIWFISIGLCLLLVQLHFNEKESLSIIVLANASILLYLSFIMFSFFEKQ